jgi:hypothetical protein
MIKMVLVYLDRENTMLNVLFLELNKKPNIDNFSRVYAILALDLNHSPAES